MYEKCIIFFFYNVVYDILVTTALGAYDVSSKLLNVSCHGM